jgi:ankyrin repeat protein
MAVDAGGSTPLHLAAMTGHLGVCQLLLRYGARINAGNAQGDTPVLVAQVCVECVLYRMCSL